MARPPAYTRNYSFSNYEANNPGQPKPGAQLDAEYDAVSNALTGTQTALASIQRDDGALANGSVGEDQLQPDLFADIADSIIAAAAAEADRAESAASSAATAASSASSAAIWASTSAQLASGSASQAGVSQTIAQGAAAEAEQSAQEAAEHAANAAQSANDAAGAVAESQLNEETSYRWAEYLAGPVAPAPPTGPGGTPYPEAVDDGMYSAKWWSLRARDLIGEFGALYLGGHPADPSVGNQGQPLVPGMLYYNTVLEAMRVWNGTSWEPMGPPAQSITSSFVYRSTAGQTTFSGLDLQGGTLVFDDQYPEPVSVFVNGVRLVETLDFTVDYPNDAVVLLDANGLTADSMVQIDLLMPSERLVPPTSGDVTGPTGALDAELVLFSGTTGKQIKRAFGSGLVVANEGVYGTQAPPAGALVGTTEPQTLTNKIIDAADNTILLPVFSTESDGVVPVSPGGDTKYLCADGTWNAPPYPPTFSATLFGLVPASGGGATNVLYADGTWRLPVNFAMNATWTGAHIFTQQVQAASFNAISARAMKHETGTLSGIADMLCRLRPILYRLIEGDTSEQIGLVAEEVHAICPQLSDGKTVAYDRLAVLLLAQWQMQQEQP